MALRALARAYSAKVSTGIVGLAVVQNARPVLMDLCRQLLSSVQVVPATAQYRVDVEKLARQRLKVCEEEKDVAAIEARIGMGQIEELIDQSKKELALIPKMAGLKLLTRLKTCVTSSCPCDSSIEWKPWDVPANHVVPESKEDWPEIPR